MFASFPVIVLSISGNKELNSLFTENYEIKVVSLLIYLLTEFFQRLTNCN